MKLKEKLNVTSILTVLVTAYLPIFSFGIFAPTEIYFANMTEFGVIFSEFGWKFLGYGTLLAVVLAFILWLLPRMLQKICLIAIWVISIGGYVQTMFLNGGIDSVGMTTEGYIPTTGEIVKSAVVWSLIAVLCIVLVLISKKKWKQLVLATSFILLAMQGVAYVSLLPQAEGQSYNVEDGELAIDASGQYSVSDQGNTIVIVLDTVCNLFYYKTDLEYPEEMESCLTDFTYFDNMDCCYWGTYPSIQHMLTGNPLNTELTIADWTYESWTNDRTTEFFNGLHENNYEVHVYDADPWLFTTGHDLSLCEGKIDNLTTATSSVVVDNERLNKVLLKCAAYRFMPNFLKSYFDVPNAEYETIVQNVDNQVTYLNTDFYKELCENGLTLDKTDKKYYIFEHLNGIHELTTDENCQPMEVRGDDDTNPTMRGMWKLIGKYFDELKELGVYDNSTIIVTADHGILYDTQPIFFVKQAGETHESMQVNSAPVSFFEFMPTIAKYCGVDTTNLGDTIYDIDPNEERTRTVLARDNNPDYPAVKSARSEGMGESNVWRAFTYTGNRDAYTEKWLAGEYEIIPMKDYL